MHNYISVEQRLRRLEAIVLNYADKIGQYAAVEELVDSLRADVEQHRHQQRTHEAITESMDAAFPRKSV